ncbi:OmpA family protein [Croceimicrobium sp.]|uniref:OmpA family protein n=1 Tax=Croceimicrobium sp. TaxID=2828340 RepID=UPI003BAD9FA1
MHRLVCFLLFFFSISLLQAQNRDAQKYMTKAREYVKENELEKALKALDDALEEDQSFVDAYLFKADIYNQLGNSDSALYQYEKARHYDFPYYLDFFQGRQLYGMKHYEECIPFLENYLQHPRANSRYQEEIERMIASSKFALEALKKVIEYNPKNLGPNVNTEELEYFPSISADSRTLVFTHRSENGQKLDEDFWYTRRDSAGAPWSEAQMLLGQLNTPGNEGAQSLSADGELIFFAACDRPGGLGSCDIYASFLGPNGQWSKAINLGPAINSHLWESQPSISPDGRTLYFVRGRSGTDPNMDIYYSEFNGKMWTKSQRLPGKVNTASQETSPYIHFDNEHLYFSSNGHPGMGDLDFFVSERQVDGTWGEPINLGHPINTSFQEFSLIVGPDGRTGFFSSDAMEEGFGKLDLYEFRLPEAAQARPIAYVEGKVIDKETRKSLRAPLKFIDLSDSTKVVHGSSNKEGAFYAVLAARSDYGLSVALKGYLFYSRNFALAEQSREEALHLLVELVPIAKGQKVILENIFFEFDSFQLTDRSNQELREMVRFLELNPDLRIRLEGHTDNQGSDSYNIELSSQRAKAVYDALVALGIDANRMEYQGKGSKEPLVANDTERNRARNRRTELHIL